MSLIFVYVTMPNKKSANILVKRLIVSRLIACANIFEIDSVYRWKKNIKSEKETAMILKTVSNNWKKVKQEIIRNHPYKTPCVVKINIEANKEFRKWMENETSKH